MLESRYNHKTGEWAHTTRLSRFPERKWLSNFDIRASSSASGIDSNQESEPSTAEESRKDALGARSESEVARALAVWDTVSPSALMKSINVLATAELRKVQSIRVKRKSGAKPSGNTDVTLTAFEDVRWFLMTSDPEISSEGDELDKSKEKTAVIRGIVNAMT